MNPAPITRDSLQTQLLAIWRSRLNRPDLGPDVSFVAAGGDSLAAMLLLADIERQTGHRLTPRTMITAPTVAMQIDHILGGQAGQTEEAGSFVTPVQTLGSRPPLFIVPGYGDALIGIRVLAGLLGTNQPLYVLDPAAPTRQDKGFDTLADLADAMIADVKRVHPEGPWHFCGHSLGAHVAWAVAGRMAADGHPKGGLILLDSNAPGYPVKKARAVRAAMKLWKAARQGPDAVRQLVEKRMDRGLQDLLPGPAPIFDPGMADELGSAANDLTQRWGEVLQMTERYTHTGFPGRVHFVRAAVRAVEIGVQDDDPACGWNALASGGVKVVTINCNHTRVLHTDHADELADLLTLCLADATRRTAPRRTGASRESILPELNLARRSAPGAKSGRQSVHAEPVRDRQPVVGAGVDDHATSKVSESRQHAQTSLKPETA